ncbi:lysylphosphatidylglycerol synthase transmembrane domain-containing protein [Polaromonas sp.]|uniref:lysylphosphatidylglycerol synthase transmembrane domain-containing protein n=1 Tax=Polaromonas sp. TaxID=1869339 RepID=UPI002731B077|nr:lysylphosphatidylglycerol synthase transmembrane domain-containing protein [Polaromonas sp.]MDP1740218.1 lysylphosphatidylglycerol synthase transmembrane domain-containing protein [Polaromonas sp.]
MRQPRPGPAAAPVVRLPLKPLLLVLATAITVYAVVLAVFGEGSALASLQRLGSWAGLQALALCLLNYLLRGLRWRRWMAHFGRPLGLIEGLRLYLAGYTFTPTPGNIGEAARGLLLARQPLSSTQSLAMFGAERLADLFVLLLMALPVVWYVSGAGGSGTAARLALALGLLVLALLVLLCLWMQFRLRLLRRLPWLDGAWRCLAIQPAAWLGLTGVAWAAQGVAVWLLCRDAGLSIGVVQAAGFYAVAMVGGALSLLPAGLGGTEALLTGLLVLHGASTAQAVGITVLVRLATLWFAVAIGALALVYSAAIRDISFR